MGIAAYVILGTSIAQGLVVRARRLNGRVFTAMVHVLVSNLLRGIVLMFCDIDAVMISTDCPAGTKVPAFVVANSSSLCKCLGQYEVGAACLCGDGYYRDSSTGLWYENHHLTKQKFEN
jgi:hypothetical protein